MSAVIPSPSVDWIEGQIDAMSSVLPSARLGIILSSGNWILETYFRAYAPADLGIHVTRMRMGSGGERRPGDIEADVLQAARLLADAKVDLIDLQGTGIMMERGPDGEAAMVAAIEDATGTPAFTATGAAVEALQALHIRRLVLVGPYGEAAVGRESAFLEAVGFSVVDAVGLARGERSNQVPPADWVAAAVAHDRDDADGIFLSGSNTRMVEAVAPIEHALGKPAVTSVQAALWAGMQRLAAKLAPSHGGEQPAPPALGRLFAGV